MFNGLLNLIISEGERQNFKESSKIIEEYINESKNFFDIIRNIGVIPECIDHDSSEEKLFAKASDIVLSRAFRELGMRSSVVMQRADAADVFAESIFHNYTLVADAKAFRLSRTAKNQKDFKVVALFN